MTALSHNSLAKSYQSHHPAKKRRKKYRYVDKVGEQNTTKTQLLYYLFQRKAFVDLEDLGSFPASQEKKEKKKYC